MMTSSFYASDLSNKQKWSFWLLFRPKTAIFAYLKGPMRKNKRSVCTKADFILSREVQCIIPIIRFSTHALVFIQCQKTEKIHIITSKGEVTLYYVRRYILIHNFKPLQIIHFLIFFHENWYKYVIFHAEFIFIHHFEKYSIV